MLDLREPHGADVAQGIGISQREAKHHYIRPKRVERKNKSLLHVVTEYQGYMRRQKERKADLLCHEQEMSVTRRHVVFDGVKGTERKREKAQR